MSLVIVGGHDRMEREYKKICKKYDCKVKVFTQMPANFRNQIGCPDAVIVFTKTVAHKMVHTVLKEAGKKNIPIIRNHSSSACALEEALQTIVKK